MGPISMRTRKHLKADANWSNISSLRRFFIPSTKINNSDKSPLKQAKAEWKQSGANCMAGKDFLEQAETG